MGPLLPELRYSNAIYSTILPCANTSTSPGVEMGYNTAPTNASNR
jgi:hypothetical protein